MAVPSYSRRIIIPNRIFTRGQMLDALELYDVTERSIDSRIKRLRKTLKEAAKNGGPDAAPAIRVVYKKGCTLELKDLSVS